MNVITDHISLYARVIILLLLIASVGIAQAEPLCPDITIYVGSTNFLSREYKPTVVEEEPAPCISKEMLLGKINPKTDTNFVVIPRHLCKNKFLYCHRTTFDAYMAMREAALKDGIQLVISSALRTFNDQKWLWNGKWKASKGKSETAKVKDIMCYLSMPGTSRHHWGTELDFNICQTAYWNTEEGKSVYEWLCENAHKFGFYQPYNNDPTRTGYKEERWHWSYRPLADSYLEAYINTISIEDITGFRGSHLAEKMKVIENYVLGIAE